MFDIKNIIEFFKEKKNLIFNISLFIIAYFLIVYFLPIERKFRYEFQKGRPWQHEDLIAPFDFPIYKLPEEIQAEKDSILHNIKPYFIYDPTVEQKMLSQLTIDYDQAWQNYYKQDSALRATDYSYRHQVPIPRKKRFDYYYTLIEKKLHTIYQKGIFDMAEVYDLLPKNLDNAMIVIYRDDIAKTYSINEVYNLKSAYETLEKYLDQLKKLYPHDAYIIQFFHNLNLNSYIKANLIYSQKKTEELKQKALASISETMGFVQAGQRIIYKGEVVDLQKYRILMSLKREYEQANLLGSRSFLIFGSAIVVLMLMLTFVLFVYNYKPDILKNPRQVSLLLLLITLVVIGASYVVKNNTFNVYILPFAIVPVIVKVFYDERMALFVHLTIIFIIGFYAPNSFEFIILQFVSGYAAIFSLSKLSRRGQLYISSAGVFVALSILYLGIGLIQEGSFQNIRWQYFLYFGINSMLVLLAYPLIYAFEKIFGFISDMTLIELSNTNNPLLRRLSLKAPGTFQHSLQVANLAESAANVIGANSLLVRVGALYHDIGKLYAPLFFIENQISGINPHNKLEFEQSANIILRHVPEGVALAQKYHLPSQVVDFIRTHHGTTVVQYFYRQYIKKYPERIEEIDKFRYKGPRPFSKETAILMMADSLEAASRAMKNIDKEKIDKLVEDIITSQINQKQFINTDLTFKEITILKEHFKQMLLSIYHPRIEYPK